MLRAVIDTNVLVAALITPQGSSARVLTELRTGAYELITSPELLAELREVLRRPKFHRYVTRTEADAYVELIRRESTVLEDPLPDDRTPVPADPDDRFLVELARAAPAHALVTGDARLLELRPAVPVLTPAEFLGRLEE